MSKKPPEQMSASGNVKVPSIHEQLSRMSAWADFLCCEDCANYPWLMDWEPQWQALGTPEMPRGEALGKMASSPLAVLFLCIEMGYYPPPELLLVLHEAWQAYLQNSGKLTLEEAFLGPPKPKAGNHAMRTSAMVRNLYLSQKLDEFLESGLTKIAAAEKLAQFMRDKGLGEYEPETLARTLKPSRARARKEK